MRHCLPPRCPTLVDHGYCTKHKTTSPTKSILQHMQVAAVQGALATVSTHCVGTARQEGLVTIATDVHHKVKHYGREESICFDWSNLMSLWCQACHDSRTLKGE